MYAPAFMSFHRRRLVARPPAGSLLRCPHIDYSEVITLSVLLEVPVDGDSVLLVEADRADIPSGLTLASPEPGGPAAKAAQSLSQSLQQLEPMLRTLKDRLVASMPDHFTVEFGVKIGGETGIILAKGTAEVNLKITMTWDRDAG